MQGELRAEIMKDCPEDFKVELSAWIDDVGFRVKSIRDLLEIDGIGQIGQVEEAHGIAKDLSDFLY